MGYPSSVVSWADITATGTVLKSEYLVEIADEAEAIQAELGSTPHGTAGSVAERLSVALAASGELVGRVRLADTDDDGRRRLRAGYFEGVTTSGGAQFEEFVSAITFDQPLQSDPLMFMTLRYLSTSSGRPEFVTWGAQRLSTTVNIYVQPASGSTLATGIPFGVYWCAVEETIDTANVEL